MANHGAFRRVSRLYKIGVQAPPSNVVQLDTLPPIAQVRLPHRLGERVAWDDVTNLLAISCSTARGTETQVIIMDPQSPQEYSVLHIPPSSDGTVGLMQLAWSPPGTPRCLMTVTNGGSILLWTQRKLGADTPALQACTVDRWYEHKPFDLPKDVVHVGWLFNPLPYSWPARDIDTDPNLVGIETRFVTDVAQEGQLPWLRPGMLAISSLNKEGELRVYWMMMGGRRWRSSNPIQLSMLSPVNSADVIATETGNLRVLASVADKPEKCMVMEVLDDPTLFVGEASSPPSMQALTNIPMGEGQSVLHLRFNPAKAGNSFLVIIQDMLVGSESLQFIWYEQTSPDTPRGWGHRGCFQDNVEDGQNTAGTGLWFSNDGCMLCVACPVGSSTKLHILTAGTLLECAKVRLPSVFTAMAYSPNATCLALIHTTGSGRVGGDGDGGSMIHLRAVDELMITLTKKDDRPLDGRMFSDDMVAANAENLADRLMWSMLCETSHWDVVSAVDMLCSSLGDTLRFGVVERVDAALHAEAHGMQPHFGVVWNQMKYFVLQGSSHPVSRVLCIDLMTRCVMDVLESTAQHTIFRDDSFLRLHKDQPNGGKYHDPNALSVLGYWMKWVRFFVDLFLRVIKTWVQQRAAAESAGDDYPDELDMLPFLRLLPDGYFWKHLTQATAGFYVLLKGCPDSKGEEAAQAMYYNNVLLTLRALSKYISNDQKTQQDGPSTDDIANNIAMANKAAQSFKGPVRLHYYRTGGGLRWQALQKCVEEIPFFKALEPITLAEVLQLVEKDGLLRPQKVADNFLRKMLGNFAEEAYTLPAADMPPGCAPPSSLAAKRKRWAAERDAAFGVMPTAMKWAGHYDVISCDKVAWDSPHLLQSTNCLFATACLQGQNFAEDSHEPALYGAWVDSCPLLGGLWRRVTKGSD